MGHRSSPNPGSGAACRARTLFPNLMAHCFVWLAIPSTHKNDAQNVMEPCVWCMRPALAIVVPASYVSAGSFTELRPRKLGAKVAVLHPQSSGAAPPLTEPVPTLLATPPILWGDWPRRSQRRELISLLRHQRVDVGMAATLPPAQP